MNSTSNEGELVWNFFGRKTDGFFTEVGANDPKASSQTWFLEERGWRGILIEPLAQFHTVLKAARPRSQVFQVACGPPGHAPTANLFVGENSEHSSLQRNIVDADTRYQQQEIVRVMTLDEVLAATDNPKIDFVSIDVEGMQLEVLKGFNLERHRPKLLFVEDHLFNWQTHCYLTHHGYRLVKRTQLNNWYIPKGDPFTMTSPWERLKLWRKVWLGTPLRRLKARRQKLKRRTHL